LSQFHTEAPKVLKSKISAHEAALNGSESYAKPRAKFDFAADNFFDTDLGFSVLRDRIFAEVSSSLNGMKLQSPVACWGFGGVSVTVHSTPHSHFSAT
jgi:hypothetical protein